MKNSSDTIGNRTHDFPTCSAVPQPSAQPRAPMESQDMYKIFTVKSKLGQSGESDSPNLKKKD
jgi:hypothetical protein